MAIAKIFGLEFTAQVVASGAWHEEVVSEAVRFPLLESGRRVTEEANCGTMG